MSAEGDVFRFDRPDGVPDEAWGQIRRQALAMLDELAEELRGTEKRLSDRLTALEEQQ